MCIVRATPCPWCGSIAQNSAGQFYHLAGCPILAHSDAPRLPGNAERPYEKQLAEIKARANAATPGPWDWEYDKLLQVFLSLRSEKEGILEQVMWDDGYEGIALAEADAEFIAHAREDIPWLVEQIERLRAALSQLVHAVGRELAVGDNPKYADEEQMQALKDLARALDTARAALKGGE